jgi:hypothetical protein
MSSTPSSYCRQGQCRDYRDTELKEIEPDPKDDSLMEIKALVDKINMLTKLVREIDSMPIVAKINKNPF